MAALGALLRVYVSKECKLKMLRNKSYSNLRVINSVSTTSPLTKPGLCLLASKSGTPIRLLEYPRFTSDFSVPDSVCNDRTAPIVPFWVVSK